MQYLQSFLLRGSSLMASAIVSRWIGTLDYKGAYYDASVDPAFPEGNTRKRIYIFWHEYIAFLLYLRHHSGLSMLLSRHRDADVLEQVASLFGFRTIRGSSNRGGAEAIRRLMQESRHSHLTITPDGPRGPYRKLAPGCVFLASKLQMPIIALGVGCYKSWRMPTWDSFVVPRPYGRARIIASPEIFIPPDLDMDGIRYYCDTIEKQMNALCHFAEDWAASGDRLVGECVMTAGPINDTVYHPYLRCAKQAE